MCILYFILGILCAVLFDGFCDIIVGLTELCKARINVHIAKYNKEIQKLSDKAEEKLSSSAIGFMIQEENDDDEFETE